MGSKGLGMGGRQTTLFANFARAPPEGGEAPPRVAPPAAPKQAKLGFSASSGTRPGTGLFETASRPEKKKTFKQGRLGQPSGAAAARPSSEDCIMVDDAPHGPSSHKASSSHNHGNGNGNVRQGGGFSPIKSGSEGRSSPLLHLRGRWTSPARGRGGSNLRSFQLQSHLFWFNPPLSWVDALDSAHVHMRTPPLQPRVCLIRGEPHAAPLSRFRLGCRGLPAHHRGVELDLDEARTGGSFCLTPSID